MQMYSFILKFQIILKEKILVRMCVKERNIDKAFMNYLAHAFLSFNHPEILMGNMMGDFIKGKQMERYDLRIQAGIKLHRSIDHFTDAHELVLQAQHLLRPEFRISSGVFIDIFFDHFLANHPDYFPDNTLLPFTEKVYATIQQQRGVLDDAMLTYFGYMEQYNWLFHYSTKEGIQRSVEGMCKRHPRLGNPVNAMSLFHEKYSYLQEHFNHFFPYLVEHAKNKLHELLPLSDGRSFE